MSKSAKKRRRKRGSSYQIKTADSDRDTASMKVSQSDSVARMNGVEVCLHEVVGIEYRGNIVRIVCPRCTERSNEPNTYGSELTAGTDVTGLPETDCNGVNDAPDAATSELMAGTDDTTLPEAACDGVNVVPDTPTSVLAIKPVDVITTDANQVDFGVLANKFEDTGSDKTFEDMMVTSGRFLLPPRRR